MRDAKVGTYGTSFSDLYKAIKATRDGGRVKGSKVLYLKNFTKENLTVSATKFWAGKAGHRASALIYQTIETEYGDKVAKRVFDQVLGQVPPEHPGPRSFPKVSLDKLRALRKVLRYERKQYSHRGMGIAPAKFSAMRRNMAKLKTKRKEYGQGDLEPGKHLRFTAENGLYFHTKWSTGLKNRFGLQTSREDKRAAAGTAIWKSIAEEYSKSIADEVFSNVFDYGALRAGGKDHKIAVTMQQFEAIEKALDNSVDPNTDKGRLNNAKKFLDTIRYTQKASPLDALAALFGPPQDNGTKAALERLKKVASPGVMQTLRERPKALLDYMRDKTQLISLLERAAKEAAGDEETVYLNGRNSSSPEARAVRETWQAVFGRWPGGAVVFADSEPADQTLTDQNIRTLLFTARLQALYSLVPKNLSLGSVRRPALYSDMPGITHFQKFWSARHNAEGRHHKMYRHLSVGDVRAYDDLLQIAAIMGAAEKGKIDLDKESRDMLTRRTAEIRTRFESLLESDRKKKLERETFIPTLQSGIKPKVKSGSPAFDDKPDVTDLLQTWQSTMAKMKDLKSTIDAVGRDIGTGSLNLVQRENDKLIVKQLQDEMDGKNKNEIHDILIDKYTALGKSLVPVWEAYQKHPWTKSMVEDYGQLGFRDDINYLEHEELHKLTASLLARQLEDVTTVVLTDAVKQAEKLETRIADL